MHRILPLVAFTLASCALPMGTETPHCLEDPDGLLHCGDRLDDDCDGQDEACPATQPADAAPAYSCTGDAPANVLAFANMSTNDQIARACILLYQGDSGAFYVAADFENGSEPQGPAGEETGLCGWDFSARRHLFLKADREDCAEVAYTYPDEVVNQVLSNECRKMALNLAIDDPDFSPDIQFMPGDLRQQETRLSRFPLLEIACLRINNNLGEPFRKDEIYAIQSTGNWQSNAAFVDGSQ